MIRKTFSLFQSSYYQEVNFMDVRNRQCFTNHILLSIITILTAAVLYLFYQNSIAEDMIREMNRDYRELAREYEVMQSKTGQKGEERQ